MSWCRRSFEQGHILMKKYGIFIFVFTLCLMLISSFLRSQYMNVSYNTFSSLKSKITSVSTNLGGLVYGKKLTEENEKLKKELSSLRSLTAENELLKKENEELSKLLSLKKRSPYKKQVTANVLSLNTVGDFSITVDRGKNDGVSVGDVAIWGNALVGKVRESFDNFSYITPITAPDATTGIMNDTLDSGLITGNLSLAYKNMCELSFFLDSATANSHDTILTSGLSHIYPQGLTVGKVHKSNDSLFVKTEVDFFKIRTISLIVSE